MPASIFFKGMLQNRFLHILLNLFFPVNFFMCEFSKNGSSIIKYDNWQGINLCKFCGYDTIKNFMLCLARAKSQEPRAKSQAHSCFDCKSIL